VSILDEIAAVKRIEVDRRQARTPLDALREQAERAPAPRGFTASLREGSPIALIAEVKRASPSAGLIREDFDPVAIAQTYQRHGARAVSVLTDEKHFQGSFQYLRDVREAIKLPVLCKDFLLTGYQVVEARAAGADAVLLIAELLDDERLRALLASAEGWGMDALVELHDPANLPRVLAAGATLVGINNRDLTTFTTDLEQTTRLAPQVVGPERLLVSESGIRTRNDVARLAQAGAGAILVGETLMRAPDIGAKVDELLGRG